VFEFPCHPRGREQLAVNSNLTMPTVSPRPGPKMVFSGAVDLRLERTLVERHEHQSNEQSNGQSKAPVWCLSGLLDWFTVRAVRPLTWRFAVRPQGFEP
jgi:hypothetical protein